MQLNVLRKWEFFLLLSPSLFGIQKFRVFFFYENWSNMGSRTWLIKLQKIVGNFSDKLRKIVPGWNAHLEIFSRIQAIENSWQSCSPNRYFAENSRWVPLQSDRKDKASGTQICIPGEETFSESIKIWVSLPQSFLKLLEKEKKVIYLMSKSKKWLLNQPSQRLKMTQNENNIKQNEKWIIHHKIWKSELCTALFKKIKIFRS